MEWIYFTVFAALMQAVRTAGQKQMTQSSSAVVATWVRYGFGLPLAIVYFIAVWFHYQFIAFEFTLGFWLYLTGAALTQLIATGLLVKVLSLRNFSVGTAYAKSEGLLAGIIAAIFFGASLNKLAWLAIIIGVAGLMLISLAKAKNKNTAGLKQNTAFLGLGAGLFFALTSVFIREANLALNAQATLAAALVLVLSLFIQGVICSVLVHKQNPKNWQQLTKNLKMGWFVGITGTLGSIGWYTAFALQEAALVKTLGNLEFVFSVLLTLFFFKERISKYEWLGLLAIATSVMVLIAA